MSWRNEGPQAALHGLVPFTIEKLERNWKEAYRTYQAKADTADLRREAVFEAVSWRADKSGSLTTWEDLPGILRRENPHRKEAQRAAAEAALAPTRASEDAWKVADQAWKSLAEELGSPEVCEAYFRDRLAAAYQAVLEAGKSQKALEDAWKACEDAWKVLEMAEVSADYASLDAPLVDSDQS